MNGIKQEPEEEEKEKEINISPQKDTNVKNNDDDNQNTQKRDDPDTKRKIIPFDERVQKLKKFKEKYGHCSVSVTYDKSLYQWCRNIKFSHRKLQETQVHGNICLTPKRIKELEDLGFDFTMKRGKYANKFPLSSSVNKPNILKSDDENSSDDSDFEEEEENYDNDEDSNDEDNNDNNDSEDMIQIQSFNDRIKALKKFKEKYGHLDVPWKCDRSLYTWCSMMRSGYKRMQKGEPSKCGLSHERVQMLKDLGFDFRPFIDRNDSSVEVSNPTSMRDTAQRKGSMDTIKDQLRKDITSFDVKSQGEKREEDDDNYYDNNDEDNSNNNDSEKMIQIQSFNDRIKALKKFKEKYGHLDVPRKYDQSLYYWSYSMRSKYKRMQKGEPSNCGLSHERIQVLKDLGFDFRGLANRKKSSVEVSNPTSMRDTAQRKGGMDTIKDQLRKDITSFDVKSQGGKRTLSNSTYCIETRTNKRMLPEPHAKTNATMRSVRPGSPAFDLARYTYEELLQQAQENKAMCQRMETNAKIRHEKSLEEIDSCIFNSDDEDSSKRKFECRFCGLKFDFQCVCILHMPKCKERKFHDPIMIKRCESYEESKSPL